jgi:hypothetical protein
LICALIANVNRDPQKSKPFTPQDFMPSAKPQETKDITADQLVTQMIFSGVAVNVQG